MELQLELLLLAMLAATAVLVALSTNLFVATMLAGIFSLLIALLFAILDAPDVAFTEAAVGAGASTLLFLATLSNTGHFHSYRKQRHLPAIILALTLGALFIYSTVGLPPYADPSAPAHQHLAQYFLTWTPAEIGVSNVVTAVLASYRGFDTLGELFIIFTAGIATIGVFSAR